MKLQKYLKREGCRNVARSLSITEASVVYNWMAMRKLPSPKNLFRLKELSKGEVSYQEMIEPFLKHQSKNA